MKRLAKITMFLFGLALALGIFGGNTAKAAKGPSTGDNGGSYISAINFNPKIDGYIYSGIGKNFADRYQQLDTITAPGMDYDEKTNTLTIENIDITSLTINEMGDDFKLKLVGVNNIGLLIIAGNTHGCGLTVKGSGSLHLITIDNMQYFTESPFAVKGKASVVLFNPIPIIRPETFNFKGSSLSEKAVKADCNYPITITEENSSKIVPLLKNGSLDWYKVLIKDGQTYYLTTEKKADTNETVFVIWSYAKKKLKKFETFNSADEYTAAGYEMVYEPSYSYICRGFEAVMFTAPAKAANIKKNGPKRGSTLTLDGLTYTVTGRAKDGNNGTVKLSAIASEDVREVLIPPTIVADGHTYEVTAIAAGVGRDNTTIKKVFIPHTIRSVGKKAFNGCTNIAFLYNCSKELNSSTVGKGAFKAMNPDCASYDWNDESGDFDRLDSLKAWLVKLQ